MISTKFAGVAAAALMTVALAACQKPAPAAPAVDTAKAAEAVKADMADLVTAFNAKDVAKAVGHDAPDYVGMMHGMANAVGPAADAEVTKMQVADPAAKLVTSDEKVDVAASGDMAVYRATYAYSYTDPKTKKPATETGNWVVGYKSVDGAWKLAWSIVSDTPAAAPPAAAK